MKITTIETTPLRIPLPKPIKTAIHQIDSVGALLLQLKTDVGLVGQSYVFTINATRLKAFDAIIQSYSHHLLQRDPHFVEGIWQDIWQELNPTGHKGMTISALSAVDTACWDLIGHHAELPLHKLFGACRQSIKTYASGGLWLQDSIDDLLNQAQHFIDQGFRAMKLRVGSSKMITDIERVKCLREAVGNDIEIMVDANQCYTAKQAIQLGRQLETYDITWFEEPTLYHDLTGHAEVRRTLNIPIASGETEYTRFGMQPLIEQAACDVLMPDLQRVGGLSEFKRVATLADIAHIPISTHIFTEHSLSLAGHIQGCLSVEHMPWFERLFNESLEIHEGEIAIPERPGCGFTFNPDAIKHYKIS